MSSPVSSFMSTVTFFAFLSVYIGAALSAPNRAVQDLPDNEKLISVMPVPNDVEDACKTKYDLLKLSSTFGTSVVTASCDTLPCQERKVNIKYKDIVNGKKKTLTTTVVIACIPPSSELMSAPLTVHEGP